MLAVADAAFFQAQVIDKDGAIRSVVVYRCGSDILWSDTMDGLFDADRRKVAPKWFVDQLNALPFERRFDFRGEVKGSVVAPVDRTEQPVAGPTLVHTESAGADDDVPGAKRA